MVRRNKVGTITRERLATSDDYRLQLPATDKFDVALILNAVGETIGSRSAEELKKNMGAAASGYLRRHATDVLAHDLLFTAALVRFCNEHIDEPSLRAEAFVWLRTFGFRV